jgi:uncharacterized protein
MNWMLKKIAWGVIIITSIIAGAGLLLMNYADSFLLRPAGITESDLNIPVNLGLEARSISSKNGQLSALYMRIEDSSRVILFCSGGTGNLYHRIPFFKECNELGISVLGFDYRGFGQSDFVEASETTLTEDAHAAYRDLLNLAWKPQSILVYGQGIGAIPAADVAMKNECAAWIGENCFPSLSDTMSDGFRQSLLQGHYDLRKILKQFTRPQIYLYGSENALIPQGLLESFASEMNFKKICRIEKADYRLIAQTHPEQWKLCIKDALAMLTENSGELITGDRAVDETDRKQIE